MHEKISHMRTELPSVLAEDCQTALQQSKGDVQKAVFTLKVCTCTHVCVCVHLCLCLHVYVCVLVYTYVCA